MGRARRWRGPRDVLRGIDLRARAGRAGRADGPQRRRQDHAPARGRGTGRARPGTDLGARRLRASRPEPRRPPGPRAGRRRAARRGGPRGPRLGGARVGGGGRPARPVRRRAPAPGAGARDGGPGRRRRLPGLVASTSRRGAWTGRARRSSRRGSARWRAAGAARRGRHARRRVRVGVRGARRAARGRRADRRRPGGGVLSGGWYFATEVARILGDGAPARSRAGAGRRGVLRASAAAEASGDELAAGARSRCSPSCWPAGSPGTSARARRRGWWRWSRRWRRSRSPGGSSWRRSPTSSRPPTSC